MVEDLRTGIHHDLQEPLRRFRQLPGEQVDRNHPLAEQRQVSGIDLSAHELVLLRRGSGIRDTFDRAIEHRGLAMSIVHDVRQCVTMDLKKPGDWIYLLGETRDELGGSHWYALKDELGANVPKATLRVTFWGALAMGLTAGVGALFGIAA